MVYTSKRMHMRNIHFLLFILMMINLSILNAQAPNLVIDPFFKPPWCITLGDQVFLDEKGRLNILGISYNDPCLDSEYSHLQGTDFQHRFNRLNRRTGAYDMSFNSLIGNGAAQNWQARILYGRARYFSLLQPRPWKIEDNGDIVIQDFFPDSIVIAGFHFYDIAETRDSGYIIAGSPQVFAPDSSFLFRRFAVKLTKDYRVDTAFFSPPNVVLPYQNVLSIEPYPGLERYLFGGSFPSWESADEPRYGIVRVFADGREDTTFHSPIKPVGGSVTKCKILDDGKILIIGGFFLKDYPDLPIDSGAMSSPVHTIARLHPNGQLDTTFRIPDYAFGVIKTFHVFENGNILIGGNFSSYQGKPRGSIALLDRDGALLDSHFSGEGFKGWQPFRPDAISSIRSFLAVEDTLYIGGIFQSFDGVKTSSSGIVKFVPATNRHTPVSPPERQPKEGRLSDSPLWDNPDQRENDAPGAVRLYPNPAADRLTVECPRGIAELRIIHLSTGDVLKRIAGNADIMPLTISDLLPGVYMIMITDTAGNQVYRRFVKM
jgi:hypothetical protein